jgi:hypothetical protein
MLPQAYTSDGEQNIEYHLNRIAASNRYADCNSNSILANSHQRSQKTAGNAKASQSVTRSFITSDNKPRETRKIFTGVRISQPKSINRKIDDVFKVSKSGSNGPRKMIMSLKRRQSSADVVMESENEHYSSSHMECHDLGFKDGDASSQHNIDPQSVICEKRSADAPSSRKYRFKNNKKTRWDVGIHNEHCIPVEMPSANDKTNASQDATQAEDSLMLLEDAIIPSEDCEDELQSDDDVVGPWHGSEETAAEADRRLSLNPESCTNSTTQDHHSQPEAVNHKLNINVAPPEDDSTLSSNLKKIEVMSDDPQIRLVNTANPNATPNASEEMTKTERRNIKIIDRVDARKAHRKEKVKPTQPPTKSSFARKTDIKMRQKKTGTKKGKGKKKAKKSAKKSIHTQEEYNTTGAFLTRGTVRQLADAHGFQPNSFNYHYMQLVEVLNINGCWYHGKLMEMDSGKVRVRYTDWKDYEWIIIGSRRLRPITESSSNNIIDLSEPQERASDEKQQENSTVAKTLISGEVHGSLQNVDSLCQAELQSLNSSVDKPLEILNDIAGHELNRKSDLSSEEASSLLSREENKSDTAQIRKKAVPQPHEYRTTGAFATRNAMRELADPHGFIPNAYG